LKRPSRQFSSCMPKESSSVYVYKSNPLPFKRPSLTCPRKFGLSNFQPADVQKIYDIQSAAKSVLPSVFQGNYNPVSRGVESSLFPTLHKLKISFYAYSPIAGGFLAKDSKSVRAKELEGRWATGTLNGDLYNTLYGKESLYKALDKWEEIAKDAGVTKAALAYRWAFWHSLLRESNGDAVIVGASKVWQFEETLKAIEDGPLTKKTLDAIEELWKTVEHDAPLDNYHDFLSKLK
jgi:aflatoxin B1 aldehyde reductase